jgi:hypothetical protein
VHDLEKELGVVLDQVKLVLEVVEAVVDLELLSQALPHRHVLGKGERTGKDITGKRETGEGREGRRSVMRLTTGKSQNARSALCAVLLLFER